MPSWYRRAHVRRSRAGGPSGENQALEMRQRFGRREPPQCRREIVFEQLERHVVRRERRPVERGLGAVEAVGVVLRDLGRAARGIRHGFAMAGVGDARRPLLDTSAETTR